MSSGSIKIIRNNDDPFAHIERAILRDNRMSLAERGFFALVLSLPTNREMTLAYFAKVSGANKETVGKYFHKLEALGYLRRYQERGDHGVFGTTIYEFTTGSPCTDFPVTAEPCTAEPATVEPCTANPSQKNKRKKDNIPPIIPREVLNAFEAYAKGDLDLMAALAGFAEKRAVSKNPINTLRSVTLLTNKLDKFSKGDAAVKIAMLDKAVLHNWASVYALTDRDLEDLRRDDVPADKPRGKRYAGTRIIDGQEVDVFE